MSKRFLLQNTAVAAIIALTATVLAASPVIGQVGDTVDGAASNDVAFVEPGEALDIDVVANDDGMDDFDQAPVLLVVDQPAGGFLSVAFDVDGIAVLLFSADVTFSGVTKGKYRACWGNSCGDAEVTVYVGGEACTIVGTNGPDTLTGTSGDDIICGLSGADIIDGKGGNDLIFGGNGKDTLRGSGGADEIYGGRGDDTIIGGNGADKLFGRKGADTISGNGGADEIHGNRGRDTISGGNGADALYGGRGRDAITGGDGADVIRGRRGDDDLRGNGNDDDVRGGRGADSIRGNGGDDTLDGGRGTDTINGGNGDDSCTRGETVSNCEDEPVEPGTDTDGDGTPDDEDDDDDNDGVADVDDAFPLDPTETTDTDGDGIGDNADPDADNDGVLNEDDAFPLDPAESLDTDGDGIGNNADDDDDGDTYVDAEDAFPLDPNEWLDTDGDGIGNNADLDDDNDGIPDVDDDDPLTPIDPTDTDGDGIPDAIDPDIDNDGIPNELDDFPNDDSESSDTDGDGIGDNTDPDADNDGVLNEDDAFPFDDGETVDSDGGGLGDNADPDDDDDGVFDDVDVFPNDGTEWEDTDGDGTGNNADTDDDDDSALDVDDAFPLDPTETLDTDFDGIGNNADDDDDNDGVLDGDDAFPLDSLVSKDTDGDGIGDLLDDDNDNDGTLDLADAFPNDPAEQSDTDLDGIGNNADPDDDGDTFNDDVDAFPLDPNEWSDLDGNGVGDNADLVADLDGDGLPDGADPDIDGDLVDNDDDAFPYDPTEWADSDGDGIGDNADTDDDDDGVPDDQDLLPNDPNTGTDSDGDGTPDTYDLDPNSADEPRFQVETQEPSGAATTIVSDGLILEDEVVITEEPVDAEDGIANVAASEIVDFTIDGPYTEFETARITIPIDPILAQQPEPVEVWWFNEEYGLWVPDGTDLQVDPTNATVSVTVDHFSKFVALRKNTRPIVVPPPGQCNDIGVDVLFLIDDSGSNEYSYIIDGQLVEASDPEVLVSEPGQPTTTQTAERVEAARDVMLGLNEATDRVAVAGFSDVLDIQDLDYIGNSQAGYTSAITRVGQIADAPDSGGTDLVSALTEGRLLLEGEGSARANAIVVVSDGGTDTYGFTQIRDAVGDNTTVHVVGVGESPNPSLATVTQAGGGVFAERRTDAGFATLLERLDELKGDFGADTDGDLLTDCEELRGMPTAKAMSYREGDTEVTVFREGFWFESDPMLVDTDGDLLWDSDELIRLDLRDDPAIADAYSAVIAAGFPEIFDLRGNPEISGDPIRADGSLNRSKFSSLFVQELADKKSDRLQEVQDALDSASVSQPPLPNEVADLYRLAVEKISLQRAVNEIRPQSATAYRALILESLPESVKSIVEDDTNSAYNLTGDAQRLTVMWGLGSRDYNLSVGEQLLLDRIDTETQIMLSPASLSAAEDAAIIKRDDLIGSLISRVPRDRNPSVTDRELREQFEKLITYSTELEVVGGATRIVRIESGGAYRLLRLFNTSDSAFAFAVTDLRSYLDSDTGVAGNSAADLGISDALHAQLVLELSVAQAQQISNFLNSEAPLSPFFTTAQDAAWRDLRDRFDRYTDDADDGSIDDPSHGVVEFRPAVLADQAPLVPSAGYPGVNSTVEASILWAEVAGEVTTSQTLMWDDVARSDLAASAWSGPFPQAGYLNEPDFNRQRPFTMSEFANEQNVPVDPSTHPGLITNEDMIQFGKVIAGYGFLGGFVEAGQLGDTIDGEIRVSRKQLENFIDARVNSGEFPEAVGEQMMQLVDAGLFDDVFDLDDVKRILTGLGFAFVVVGGVVAVLATGPAGYFAAVALHAAGAAAESGVIAIDLVQGNIGSAYLGSLLLLVGGAGDVAAIYNSAADAAIAATRPAARIVAGGTDLADLPALLRQVDVPALDEYAAVIETSSAGVLSSGQQAALSGFAVRSHLVDEFELLGVDPLLARSLANESVERLALELDAQQLAAYRALADQIDDVIDLRVATRFGPSELDDPALRSFVADCVGANSFSGDTLVVLADGTLAPIADIQLGDQVLAYDFDTGETVAREVTATLPHTDWLLQAHLSDGSVMSVTEDHRFWSITDNAWVELQDLDTTDILLTPDGVTVTVDWLDWDAGVDAAAWDLTVDQEHNFFVAADALAVPVLVHNATRGAFCGEIIDPSRAAHLFDVESRLDDDVVVGLTSFFESASTTDEAADALIDTISAASVADGAVIARNAQVSFTTTRTVLNQGADAADVIFTSARYEELVDVGFRGDLVAGVVRQLQGRPVVEQRRIAANIFNSPEAAAMVELASRNPNDQLVTLLAGAAGVSPSDPLLVAEKLAELSDLRGSWDLVDDAFAALDESFVNGLSRDTKDFIRGRRFDNRRASAFENNQVYLDTGRVNSETGRKVYVIVDSVDSGPPARIVSRKVSQIADVQASQIVRDLREARTKYSPGLFPVADVPSRPIGLDAGDTLGGQLTLELPTQDIPTGAAELATYNSKLATICEAALAGSEFVDGVVRPFVKVDVLDEAGNNLCPGNP